MVKPAIIGIDLGTTFSVMSYIDDNGLPRVIPNAEGKELTPSLVFIKEGLIEVGESVDHKKVIEKEHVVVSIKRSMGDDKYTFAGFTPTEISAEILKKLKRDAESHFGHPVNEAVITVPAYFADKQRKATYEAGELAGFLVKDLPNEPTAAALYYGTKQMQDGERVLVYDLGGGTFDATVLLYQNDNFKVLATDGSRELGGQDWTKALYRHVSGKYAERFGEQPEYNIRVAETLLNECERAKQNLTRLPAVEIPLNYEGKIASLTVTIDSFNDLTEALIVQTLEKSKDALRKANIQWQDITKLLLVGGSSRLKQVSQKLKEVSGITPTKFMNVDTLVSLGAALYTRQQIMPDGRRQITITQPGKGVTFKTIEETTAFGLGTVVVSSDGGEAKLVTSVVIFPQTAIPARQSRQDYQVDSHQTRIDIPIVEADEDGLDPRSCQINKTYSFTGIPDRSRPSSIEVVFSYDRTEMIDVDAVDLKTGQKLVKTVIPFQLPKVGKIAKTPNIVLLIDTSSSMAVGPLREAKKQIQQVCDDLMGQNGSCNVGLVQFGNRTETVCPITGNIKEIKKTVDTLLAGGSTPMAEGIDLAYGMLSQQNDPRFAVLVSDGAPNNPKTAEASANKLKSAGIALYTISIGQTGASFLQSIGNGYAQILSATGLSDAINNLLKIKR